jgi:hypothetical protein
VKEQQITVDSNKKGGCTGTIGTQEAKEVADGSFKSS